MDCICSSRWKALLSFILIGTSSYVSGFLHSPSKEQIVIDDEAIRQLGEVFDIPALKIKSRDIRDGDLNRTSRSHHPAAPRNQEHASPSQYMLDLYHTIADQNGVMRIPNPYNANLIRSFQNKDMSGNNRVYFDLSSVNAAERILQAELHLQILTPPSARITPHNIIITLYQISSVNSESQRRSSQEEQRTRLTSRHVQIQSANQTVVLPIRTAVLDWIIDSDLNKGLEIEVTREGPSVYHHLTYTLAKRTANPTLIVFIDDGRDKQNSKYRIKDPSKQSAYLRSRLRRLGHEELLSSFTWALEPRYNLSDDSSSSFEESRLLLSSPLRHRRRRDRRATALSAPMQKIKKQRKKYHRVDRIRGPCRRHELFVNFEEIGWSSWIISPKGFHAFHCRGDCHFPIGQESKPSNHATVISIINHMKLRKRVGAPCCVPEKLYSISLLYFDNEQNVVLKQYDDMVAQSCACR